MHCYLIISAGHRVLKNSENKKGLFQCHQKEKHTVENNPIPAVYPFPFDTMGSS